MDTLDTTDSGQQDKDLQCPVCLSTFKDPCFVCQNHHTLCRRCYNGIIEEARSEAEARCPECRDPLVTPAVQNKSMYRLIQALKSNPRLTAICQMTERGQQCSMPVLARCHHCDRDLCDLHFSAHRMKFQDDCQKLLLQLEHDSEEADRVSESLRQWNHLIKDLIDFLELEKSCLEQLLNSTQRKVEIAGSISNRSSEAAALREALRCGNVRVAKARLDQLNSVTSGTSLGAENVGQPPSCEQKEEIDAAKNSINAIIGIITGMCGGIDELNDVYDECVSLYARSGDYLLL